MTTIKSTTNCPTCGSECNVVGDSTHNYEPKYTKETQKKTLKELCANDADLRNEVDRLLYDRTQLMLRKAVSFGASYHSLNDWISENI